MTRALAIFLLTALPAGAETVTVFAAASLQGPVDQIAADWQAATGNTVQISYAGTAQLARQLQAGAPADVFLSASQDWMTAVADEGLLVGDGIRPIAGNTLVLIGHGVVRPTTVPEALAGLGDGKLAMALVDSVPAGQYGKEALQNLGLWDAVEPQVVQADNVRAAFALVATGEAPLGIVYLTDARADRDRRVTIVARFPADSHAPIVYEGALTATANGSAAGFLDALTAPEGQQAFAMAGFAPPPGPDAE
jgi:molybdate transport system substrate-binding protein